MRRDGALGGPASTDVTQFAEICAQNVVLAIPQHLDEFRGASRFTTWVCSFAINTALVAARRERWKRMPLDQVIQRQALGSW